MGRVRRSTYYMLSLDFSTAQHYISSMINVWMLFLAVVLQDGEPVWTRAMSFKTQAECQIARTQAIEVLTQETKTPNPDNAGGFVVKECELVQVPYVYTKDST